MMEQIKCIFCEKENYNIVIEENGFQGRKCSECGLIYISPRPSVDEIINLYGHNNAYISAESHISAEFFKKLYAKHNLKILTSFSKNGTLLEIGAGAGYFLNEARKRGFEPYGIEINSVQAEFIRNKLEIPCDESPLSPRSFEGRRFDQIYHCDVASHFYDPISEFLKFHRKLKPEGLLMFETGNLGEVDQRYFKHIHQFQYPDHLFFFSVNNIRELLKRTGFEFVRLYRYSILLQLAFTNFARRMISSVKPEKKVMNITAPLSVNSCESVLRSIGAFNAKIVLKRSWDCFNYIIRYKIGYLMPKARRPQTIIIVARKRNR